MKIFLSRLWDVAALIVGWITLCVIIVYLGRFPISPLAPLNALKYFGLDWPNWFQYGLIGCAFLTAILCIVNPWRWDKKAYGAAKWASEKDLKEFGLRGNEGMIFGVKGGRYIRSEEPLSAMLYAPPGSGKTQGVVVPSVVSTSNSVIVHDPKGELFKLTAPFRSHFSRVVRFSPGEVNSARWNPLGGHELPQGWPEIQTYVSRVCNAVFRAKREADEGSYWLLACRSIFMFWALYLVFKNPKKGTSLAAILKVASTANPQESIQRELLIHQKALDKIEFLKAELLKPSNKRKNPHKTQEEYDSEIAAEEKNLLPDRIVTEGNQIVSKADREFSGVLGNFNSYMEVFLDERVATNTSTPDKEDDDTHLFSMTELRSSCMSIYLTVSTSDQERLKPIISLFFEFAVLTLISKEPNEEDQRVTLFLDEFVRLAKLDEVLRLPEIGRGYGVNALFVCQSLSQLVKIYGEAGANSLKNTTAYHLVFSQNESKVAEDLSRAIGQRTRKRHSASTSSRDLHVSKSESAEGVALVTPQQIMSLPKGQLLVLVQNHFERPIKAQVAFWFKDQTLKRAIELRG